jgi:hypothetical protein
MWGSTLDLRDAYLHIPMFPPHRKYLRFCVQGVHYQFRAMPFGITVAPRVFTKLMAAVGGHLRSQQIHIFMYLDDWLVKNQIRELLLHQLNQTIQLLVDLGLIINLDKCHLVHSQIITYRKNPCCNYDAEGHGSKLVMNSLYTKPQILPARWKHGNL